MMLRKVRRHTVLLFVFCIVLLFYAKFYYLLSNTTIENLYSTHYDSFKQRKIYHTYNIEQQTKKNQNDASQLFPGYNKLSHEDLKNKPVPNTIHYVWCHNRTLSFENYLSIMSAWKYMRPDAIELHSIYEFNDTEERYNTWLIELKKTVSGFSVRKIPENWSGQEHGCGFWFGIAVLDDRGGIYFSENLLLMKPLTDYRNRNFTLGINNHADEISFIFSRENEKRLDDLINLKLKQELSINSFNKTVVCEIIPKGKIINTDHEIECVELSSIFPVDIMYSNTSVASVARHVFYGSNEIVSDRPILPGKIPKIVHLVWYREKEMDFEMYLSLKSVMTIIKPDKVFIHGDNLLKGKYFNKFAKDPRIHMIYRELPDTIFGHKVLYTQHKSDIVRADVLLKYGGIYMDWDVLWLKPIDDLLNKGYDAIFNFDHMTRNGFPDVINLGVFMAKPNSHFVKYWQDSLLNYRSLDFYHNALELPYKTYEKYPQYVHVERHLQVMCFHLMCHPTFRKEYHNFNKEQYFDWHKEAYSIHFTYPDPPEYANETALKQGYNKFAEIGQYIYKQKYEYD